MFVKLMSLSALLFCIASCTSCTKTMLTDAKIIPVNNCADSLAMRTYKQLGFRVSLPKDLIYEKVYNDKKWRSLYDCRTLRFVIAQAPNAGWDDTDMNVIEGHINIYSSSEYKAWLKRPGAIFEGGETIKKNGLFDWSQEDEQFNSLQRHAQCLNKWGLKQTTFRMDRKSSDGRVIQAMITRMDYTADITIEKNEIALISNILNSVEFE